MTLFCSDCWEIQFYKVANSLRGILEAPVQCVETTAQVYNLAFGAAALGTIDIIKPTSLGNVLTMWSACYLRCGVQYNPFLMLFSRTSSHLSNGTKEKCLKLNTLQSLSQIRSFTTRDSTTSDRYENNQVIVSSIIVLMLKLCVFEF